MSFKHKWDSLISPVPEAKFLPSWKVLFILLFSLWATSARYTTATYIGIIHTNLICTVSCLSGFFGKNKRKLKIIKSWLMESLKFGSVLAHIHLWLICIANGWASLSALPLLDWKFRFQLVWTHFPKNFDTESEWTLCLISIFFFHF